jgi:ribosomal protein S27E
MLNARQFPRVEHVKVNCPCCGHNALVFTHAPHRDDREAMTVLVKCLHCGAGVSRVSLTSGIPVSRLLYWPVPDELGPPVDYATRPDSTPAALPSIGAVGGWAAALLSSPEPLAYLTERRQLGIEVIREYSIGYSLDSGDLMFPIFAPDRLKLTGLLRRKPVDGAQVRVPLGHKRQPYPDLPATGALCLVGGELDSLTGRQLGLRALNIGGCNPGESAYPLFTGRVVYVLFDVGEELHAARAARRLSAVGATAYVAYLRDLDLPHGADLNDAFCAGLERDDLERLLRRSRKRDGAKSS